MAASSVSLRLVTSPAGPDAPAAPASTRGSAPVSTPRARELTLCPTPGCEVVAYDDPFSDRVRCDHPTAEQSDGLPEALVEEAEARKRGRVVVLVPESLSPPFANAGYEVEGLMPGFYAGEESCAVMGLALTAEREGLANPLDAARVDEIVAAAGSGRMHEAVPTRRAEPGDAEALANLIDETFSDYPTPSHDPSYIAQQLRHGTPFRVVESKGQIVACASADLVPDALTAELTDCATKPSKRGRGYMQFILRDLMSDLGRMGYPTAFTLARARIPGVNIAFKRLGFSFRGRMVQSCRIGDGIEDMNIWSRRIAS